ncbi:MAG: gliding motility-associated C-terminal domain-containing protein, partial [Chitinophagaceae bacterium]|nr:gliding motility-associated C-terminal domain-containing protein [Chitinophagaceae bacterium]
GTVSTASVGTYSITASNATGATVSNYTITYVPGTLTVTSAPLTITANDQSKVYGTTGPLGSAAFSVTGLASGESISSVTLSSPGTVSTASVGTYSITASNATGATVSNYTINYVTGTLTVTEAPLTITADAQSKVYGTTGTLGSSAFSVTGLVAGESISSVTLSSPGTLSTAAVGTYSITASNATGSTVSNYAISYVTGTLTVTAAPLTITANDQSKVYGTTGTLSSSAFSVTGLAAGENINSVTLSSAGTVSTAAVGTYSITASNATGSTVSNYTITYVSGTLTVTSAPLTITANDQSKVYGSTGTLGSSAFSVTGLAAGESISSVSLNSPGTVSTAAVGTYSITASSATGSTVSNYTISYVTGTLTVTAAPLTITADAQSKVYGTTGTLGSSAFSVTGLASGESISSVTLSSPGTVSTASVGTYSITASNATGATISNYTINYVTGTLTVTAAPLTITANDQSKVYGTNGTLGSSAFSVTGLMAGESVSSVTLSSLGTLSTAAVGAYSITASNATGSTIANYAINYVSGTLTVTSAPLTITANDQNKVYGTTGTLGSSAFSVTGLAAGESISSVTLSSPGAVSTAAMGTYSITASNATGSTVSNYTISYISGTLTVTAAPLTITANDQSKVYGATGTLGSTAFSATGLVAGDNISSVTLSSPGTPSNASAGTYSITISNPTGITLSNYVINYVSGTLTVTAAPLTITADAQSKVYGTTGTLGSSAFSVTGLVAGESISSVTLSSPGAVSTATVGTYSITASNATGTTVANYTINYVSGTLTVTAAPLTITANAQSKVYGTNGTLGSSAFSVTGLVSGDSINDVTLSSPGTLSTAAAGAYSITASNATGAAVSNYTISYVSGILTVTAAPLTITANDQRKVYGINGTLDATAFSVTGLLAGESISSVTLNSLGTPSAASAGAYTISVSGATGNFTAANYNIRYVPGTLTVQAATITITATDLSKKYGETLTLPSSSFSVTGMANGDTISSVTLSSNGAVATAPAGVYSLTASSASGNFNADNYIIVYQAGSLTVQKALLTIIASDAAKNYGQLVTLAAYTANGLVNGDVISSVVLSSPGTSATAVAGVYSITASGATGTSLSNYNIVYAPGTLTVSGQQLPLLAGAIASSQTICSGVVPDVLTSVADASGGAGTIRYQWQQSLDSIQFTDITGANSAGLTLVAHTKNIYYRRMAYTTNDSSVYANIVNITILPAPVISGGIIGDCAVLADSVKTYSVNPATNATRYVWTLPNGWTGSSVTNSIQVTPSANNGVITVLPYNGACAGTGVNMNVSVIDLAKSTLVANPPTATGDNLNTSTVTLQLIDVAGNAITCSAPQISFCGTTGTVIGSVTDNNNGSYSAKVRSYADTIVVCASVGNTKFKQTATIVFSGPQGSISGNGPIFATETPYLTFNITQGVAPYTVIYKAANRAQNDTLTNVVSNVPIAVANIAATTGYKLVSIIGADNGRRNNDFIRDTATIQVLDPKILVTLTSDQPVLVKDSTYATRLKIDVTNTGDVDLQSVQVSANLADVFPTPVEFVLDSVSYNGNTVNQNPNFDGKNNFNLFAWTQMPGKRIFDNPYPELRPRTAEVMAMTTVPVAIPVYTGLAEEGLTGSVEMATPVTYLSAELPEPTPVPAEAPGLQDPQLAAAPAAPYFFGTLSRLNIGQDARIFLYVSIKPNGYKKPFVMQVAAVGTGTTPNGTALANSISNDNERQAVHPELTGKGEPLPTVISILPDPSIGLALKTGTPVMQADSSYNVELSYVVGNYGNVNLRSVALYQNLLRSIAAPDVFKVLSVSTPTGSLVVNPAYDGRIDTNLLSSVSTLPFDRQGEVKMLINIKPNSYSSIYKLQAKASGFSAETQSAVSDLSTDGTNPDPNGDGLSDEKLISYIVINKTIPVLESGKVAIRNRRETNGFCGPTANVVVAELTAPSGGDESYSFQWQRSADNISYANIAGATENNYITDSVTTSIYLRRRVISGNQMKYSEPVYIQINTVVKPVINTNGSLYLSGNDSVLVVASDGMAYQWSNGANTQAVVVKTAGNYFVTVTDQNGCQASSDAVTVLPAPPVVRNATYIIGSVSNPANISVQVSATIPGAALKYYLSLNAPNSVSAPGLPAVSGSTVYYASQVVNGLESKRIPVQVTMLNPLAVSRLEKVMSKQAELQADGSFIIGFTFRLFNLRPELLDSLLVKDDLTKVFPFSEKLQVLSLTASGKLVVNPFYDGLSKIEMLSDKSQLAGLQRDSISLLIKVYPGGFAGALNNTAYLTAVSPYGKFTIASTQIISTDPSSTGGAPEDPQPTRFLIPEVKIFIPDAFSPNRDGKNDTYVIIRPYTTQISLEIYNRWGNLVYRANDYRNEWDGRGNQSSLFGTELADGTYYYIVTATDKLTGKLDRFKGYVVLKR